jgi:Protein of unknown function (DUF1580)
MAIENEAPLRLAEVPAVIAEVTGEAVNFKTVYRWTVKGRRGVRLETRPGIRKRTSREAVLRFLARLAGRENQPTPAKLNQAQKRQQAAKNRALVAAGR